MRKVATPKNLKHLKAKLVEEDNIIELINKLGKPNCDYPPDFDFKKAYYEEIGKRYGL